MPVARFDSSVPRTHDPYVAAPDRYSGTGYRRVGRPGCCCRRSRSGSGTTSATTAPSTTQRAVLRYAFDIGITHFDLANNYGPPYGAAEENFGRMLRADFPPYRDELIISTKAGWDMWPGPYGHLGLAQVPARQPRRRRCSGMSLDHVDIFYSHRVDPDTPLEETIGALDPRCAQGKALYVGISSYSRRAHPRGRRDRRGPRHAAGDPPAVVLAAQPLDRGRPHRRAERQRHGRHRIHRRWRRDCSRSAT